MSYLERISLGVFLNNITIGINPQTELIPYKNTKKASKEGYNGLILVDDRISFNVSAIPVVIQGTFYPPVKEDFRKRGYEIQSKRKVMSPWQKIKYDFKRKAAHFPYFHKQMKWI